MSATPNIYARPRRAAGRFAQILLLTVIVVAVGFGFWAKDLPMTAVVQGDGVVAPLGKVMRVFSASSGAVAPHRIREGMTVTEGQVLFRVETVKEVAVLQNAAPVSKALRATVARLAAEVAGAERVAFPEGLASSAEAERERVLFMEGRSKRERALQALRDSVTQSRLEIAEQQAKAASAQRARDLAQKELDVVGPLADRGISPKLEFLRVQQKVQALEAERERALFAVPRLEAAVRDAERRIDDLATEFRTDAKRLLAAKQREIAASNRVVVTKKRSVTTTEIRAPVHGEVRRVFVARSGATIGAGQEVAMITPRVKELFIDVRVPDSTVANFRPDQVAIVTHGAETSAKAELIGVGPREPGDGTFSHIRLRVKTGSPGFDALAKAGLDVSVVLQYEQPIVEYLFGRISDASRGRLPGRLMR